MIDLAFNSRYKKRPVTGVERFASEVERELRQCDDVQIHEIIPAKRLDGLKGHIWEQFSLPGELGAGTILISPCNTGPLAVEDQVVVIHDAAVWDQPDGFDFKFRATYRNLLPRLARKARVVATVSEFSRSRLSWHLGIPEDEISIVSNAVSDAFHPSIDLPPDDSDRLRFLSVSSMDPRKNFDRLIRAWENLVTSGQLPGNAELRIAGGSNPQNFTTTKLENSESVKWLGRISDEQLIEEYQRASAFIFPSLYEGFGLPPLEAMACGCPVLMSDAASLPEVGGPGFDHRDENSRGAAIYFDPGKTAAIEGAIFDFTKLGPSDVGRLSENAVRRSSRFNWRQSAAQLLDAIRNHW